MANVDLQAALDLIEVGQAEEAIPSLTTWAQQMPAHAAVHVVLARAYEAGAYWAKARAAWQHARFLMPNSPAVREGLDRVRAAIAEQGGDGEDRLIMDLDLQAELEATLEALFNPFTLPQQQAEGPDEVPPPTETEALAQVEAALAAAEADADDDTTPIDEEIDQQGNATWTLTDPEAPEDRPIAEGAEHEPVEHEGLPGAMSDVPEADDAVAAADPRWGETEHEDAPPAEDATLDDLDRLISELEAARIVPQPDLVNIPPPELEDEIDDMVSETLARIYASQKKYDEAARVYEQLAYQQPEEADKFRQLAAEMHAHAGEPGPQESPETEG